MTSRIVRRESPVTWTERRKAQRIVGILRQSNNLIAVSKFLAVPEIYISMAEHMLKRRQSEIETYHCPSWAIRHILQLDLMQADISDMRI
jgi:hypothetical protein